MLGQMQVKRRLFIRGLWLNMYIFEQYENNTVLGSKVNIACDEKSAASHGCRKLINNTHGLTADHVKKSGSTVAMKKTIRFR